ncbi:hypothetical protein CTI12_AA479600 [Artemisia annua]|uniref:Uncharacterized protein n=1 Tax=Artemisia annua TaxID=35608 RepID=A0A2U1LKZ8_ARTAN|nr:hypothetical protein CTI12_AA479600 [Artemisia annua]
MVRLRVIAGINDDTFGNPYVKSSSTLLPNDDSEAHHDQDIGDESPHVDGTGSSEGTSPDPGATHNVDGTESLNSESGINDDTFGKYFGPLMSDCWNQGVIAVKMESS